jgi:5'-nucleotidase / UDP-sugar diphosphatase
VFQGFIVTHILRNASVRRLLALALLCASAILQACSSTGGYQLAIAHLNDSHSHLEATPLTLVVDGHRTVVQAGGFASLQTLVEEMRGVNPDLLLLHAGDAVQGTLYFTLFNGQPEFDFLNRLGVAAMTLGNHEFDRGSATIPSYLQAVHFPVVSSNIDFSGDAATAALHVPTRIVKEISGERIGIIGLTTETTPQTTLDVGQVKFLDARTSAEREVAALTAQGINKIVLLSHLGYEQDLKLAAAVSGIDIIVGGHSHSLLGSAASLAPLGLVPDGPYPTEVLAPDGNRVLVLQAWKWAQMLGRLDARFDAQGRITGYAAKPVIPVANRFVRDAVPVPPDSPAYAQIVQSFNQGGLVRLVKEDPKAAATLVPYRAQLATYRTATVASAAEDLLRGINSGPGPLVADSMLAAVPRAQVAILNNGGVRKDLFAGSISVGDVLELLPFSNTLVLLDLSGAELKEALEGDIDFLIGKKNPSPYPYAAGLRFTVARHAGKGQRVTALAIRDDAGVYQPLRPDGIYRCVVSNFVAGGGDGFTGIRNTRGFRSDSGIIDSDALRDHFMKLGIVHQPTEQRVTELAP